MRNKRCFRYAVQGPMNQTAVGATFATLREAREALPAAQARREQNGQPPIVCIKEISGIRTVATHSIATEDDDEE